MSVKGVKAGEAYVELGIRSQIDKGLKQAGAKMRKWGGGLAAVGAAATGAAAAALGKPLMLASEMEETMGKFNVVFGESAGEMEAWSNSTAKALGTSRQAMAEMTSGMQDLLVPMGLAPDQAMEFSKGLSKLAVDLGSFNNRATPDVMNDLMAAMTGSGEVMKKYGVILNVANMEQKAYALGLAETGAKLTDVQKAQAAYAIIMDSTTTAQGDAIRTQASFANQMKRFRSGLQDLGTMLGQAVLPPLTKVITLFGKGVQFAIDWGRKNQWAMDILGKGLLAVGAAGAVLLGAGGTLALLGTAFTGVATAITAVGTAAGVVLSPMGAVVGGITVAVGALALQFVAVLKEAGKLELFFDIWKKAFQDIGRVAKKTFGGIVQAISSGDIEMAMEVAMAGVQAVVFRSLAVIAEVFNEFVDEMLATLAQLGKKALKLARGSFGVGQLIGDFITGRDPIETNLGTGTFLDRAKAAEDRLDVLLEELRKQGGQEPGAPQPGDQAATDMSQTNGLLEQIVQNTRTPTAVLG